MGVFLPKPRARMRGALLILPLLGCASALPQGGFLSGIGNAFNNFFGGDNQGSRPPPRQAQRPRPQQPPRFQQQQFQQPQQQFQQQQQQQFQPQPPRQQPAAPSFNPRPTAARGKGLLRVDGHGACLPGQPGQAGQLQQIDCSRCTALLLGRWCCGSCKRSCVVEQPECEADPIQRERPLVSHRRG